MRAIDADVLKKHFADCLSTELFDKDMKKAIFAIEVYVDLMPTIETNFTKQAEWKINSDGYYPYCSCCGVEPESGKMTKYCANCGAEMKRED